MKAMFGLLLALAYAGSASAANYDGYIIKLRSGVETAKSDEVLKKSGIEVRSRIPQLNLVVGKTKARNPGADHGLNSAAAALIEYIEPNYFVHATARNPYSDSSHLWGMKAIKARAAWERGFTGDRSVVVAVSDTGIWKHGDLEANFWNNPGEIPKNKKDDDGNGLVDDVTGWTFIGRGSSNTTDDQGHGTHVAGTIGAQGGNGMGVAGVSWAVRMMALKFLDSSGSGTTEDGIRTILYAADHGARAINCSWGGDGYTRSLWEAIEYAKGKGMLVVAAAGNDGSDNDKKPHYPSNYDNENLIAVAASAGQKHELASFSNYGFRSVHLAAPGQDIQSTWSPMLNSSTRGFYQILSGTSMATPHVTGAAALVYSVNPALDWRQVKEILLTSVTPVAKLQGKILTGGVLNVDAAVQKAVESRP